MNTESRRRNNFSYLLGGLLLLFLLPPCLHLYAGASLDVDLMRALMLTGFSLFMIISVWSLHRRHWTFHLGLGLAAVNISIAVAELIHHERLFELAASVSVIMFSVLSCYIAGRHVFGFRETDANTLVGAVCVYLLLGLIWAVVYTIFAFFWPEGAFQGLTLEAGKSQFDNFLYFSFVTLTTAGYGDITPLNPLVRMAAYMEMIVGQFYMAILVSGLVAHFMGQRMSR